jgi:hypothetical protein
MLTTLYTIMLLSGRKGVFSPQRAHPSPMVMLKASYLPTKVAAIHCKGHQPETTEIAQGIAFADRKAKRTSTQIPPMTLFITTPKINPTYTAEEQNGLVSLGDTPGSQGWFLLNGKYVLPNTQPEGVLRAIHKALHIGAKPLLHFLQTLFFHPSLPSVIKKITQECPLVPRFPPSMA